MNEFFRNNIIRLLLIISLSLNLALFLFFYFFIKQSEIPIVLHYNVDWGVDYFGEIKNIYVLPLVGLIILLLNSVLCIKLWNKTRSLSYFLTTTTLISEVFLWIAGIALYIINS